MKICSDLRSILIGSRMECMSRPTHIHTLSPQMIPLRCLVTPEAAGVGVALGLCVSLVVAVSSMEQPVLSGCPGEGLSPEGILRKVPSQADSGTGRPKLSQAAMGIN